MRRWDDAFYILYPLSGEQPVNGVERLRASSEPYLATNPPREIGHVRYINIQAFESKLQNFQVSFVSQFPKET